MEDVTYKKIKITGIESSEKKIILLQDKEKYYFWITKTDGTNTKAYDQFQKFRFIAGDEVEIGVTEEERSFVNEKGKSITYTDRKIAFFKTADGTTPYQSKEPKDDTIQKMRTAFADHEKRIKYLEEYVAKNVIPLV